MMAATTQVEVPKDKETEGLICHQNYQIKVGNGMQVLNLQELEKNFQCCGSPFMYAQELGFFVKKCFLYYLAQVRNFPPFM